MLFNNCQKCFYAGVIKVRLACIEKTGNVIPFNFKGECHQNEKNHNL